MPRLSKAIALAGSLAEINPLSSIKALAFAGPFSRELSK